MSLPQGPKLDFLEASEVGKSTVACRPARFDIELVLPMMVCST
jgi:hypothetical protein